MANRSPKINAERWEKGGPSPNPGGRPKAVREVAEMARVCTEAAIVTLAQIMRNEDAPESARVRAIEVLLERGWGKPAQPLEHSGPHGEPFATMSDADLAVKLRVMLEQLQK